MKKLFILTAILMLSACVHKNVEKVEDLRIGDLYPLVNVENEDAKMCTIKAENIVTTIVTSDGVAVPMRLIKGTTGYVCGEIDCSKTEGKILSEEHNCIEFEALVEFKDTEK